MNVELNIGKKDLIILEPYQGFRDLFQSLFRDNKVEVSFIFAQNFGELQTMLDEVKIVCRCCFVSIDYKNDYDGWAAVEYLQHKHPEIEIVLTCINERLLVRTGNELAYFKKEFLPRHTYDNLIKIYSILKGFRRDEVLHLKLFTQGGTRYESDIRGMLQKFEIKYQLEIVDAITRMDLYEKYKIQAFPTIIRENPPPIAHYIGECSTEKQLLDLICR